MNATFVIINNRGHADLRLRVRIMSKAEPTILRSAETDQVALGISGEGEVLSRRVLVAVKVAEFGIGTGEIRLDLAGKAGEIKMLVGPNEPAKSKGVT